jgi:O-acetylserine/cysteine efflux transporter
VRAQDAALALLVALIWGCAFVPTKLALETLSPPQLTALRFLSAAVPAAFLPRPPVPWLLLIATGLTLFAGQFLFQFLGIASGMPLGLAAVVIHTQAVFTILLAALVLRERPTRRQIGGTALALAGLALIAMTLGADLTLVSLGLTLVSPVSWAVGNVLLKRAPPVDMVPLVVWLSLVPPLPALALSAIVDGPGPLGRALTVWSWREVATVLYLGVVATTVAYAIWAKLLRRYPAATVTPFALLVPFVAAGSSSLVFGERFGPVRVTGMALVLGGLAVILFPTRRRS